MLLATKATRISGAGDSNTGKLKLADPVNLTYLVGTVRHRTLAGLSV